MALKDAFLPSEFAEKLKQIDNVDIKSRILVSGYFRECQHILFGEICNENAYYNIPPNIEIISLIYFDFTKPTVTIKIGILGDGQVGKTSLMVKYIEDKYDEGYIETLGINFMEKTIELKKVDVTISIVDLGGGSREFSYIFPTVCDNAKVILFVFDLSQKQSLFSIKRWYKEARKQNKIFMPFLVGCKYDLFKDDVMSDDQRTDITVTARKFASKMKAPLIYCSSLQSINIKKIFKIVIAKCFDLKPKIKEKHDYQSEALLEYVTKKRKTKKKRKKPKQLKESTTVSAT